MPNIPRFPISQDPRIQVTRSPRVNIARGGPTAGGVSRFGAVGTAQKSIIRAPNVNVRVPQISFRGLKSFDITALTKGLGMLEAGLGEYGEYRAKKAEIARRAKILELIPIIKSRFDAVQQGFQTRIGANAAGTPEDIAEQKQGIDDEFLTSDLDPQSKNDITSILNREYDKLLTWGQSWELIQFGVADKAAIERIHRNVTNAAIKIPPPKPGEKFNIEAIHAIVELEGMSQFAYLHTDLPKEILEDNRKAMVEDATAAMLQSWIADNPAAAVKYFDANDTMLKAIMPEHHTQIAKQMDAARGDAAIDTALLVTARAFKGNKGLMAGAFQDEDFILRNNLDPSKAFTTASTLMGMHQAETRARETAIDNRETAFMQKLAEDNSNDQGVPDYTAMIGGLEKAWRNGRLREPTYRQALTNWTKMQFTNEDAIALHEDIQNGDVPTRSKILARLGGTANPAAFFKTLDEKEDADATFKNVNYYQEAVDFYREGMKGKDKTQFGKVAKNEAEFKRKLRSWMAEDKLTYRDSAIMDSVIKRFGPATKIGTEVTAEPERDFEFGFRPGEQGVFQLLQEKAEKEKTEKAVSQIGAPTSVTQKVQAAKVDSTIEIATGGNLDRPEDQEAISRAKAVNHPITSQTIELYNQLIAAEQEADRLSALEDLKEEED